MDPQTPIGNLPGIGKYHSQKLKKLEIKTLDNLIYHFPFRYDDFSKIERIQNATPGEKLSVRGIVWQIKNIRTPRGKFVTTATVADQSGVIEIIWFNQPFLTKNIKAGMPISLSGKVEVNGHRLRLVSPSYEIIRNTSYPVNDEARLWRQLPVTNNSSSLSLRAEGQSTLHTGITDCP